MTIATISRSILQLVISFLMAKLRPAIFWLQESISFAKPMMKGQYLQQPYPRNVNNLHVELGHPSETIAPATAKALGNQVTGTFKPHEDCTLGKAKQFAISKKAVPWLFFDISSPSTTAFGGKHHWLLVIDGFNNYILSFFLKKKSDLVETKVGLLKNLKLNLIYRYNSSTVTMQEKINTC